MTGTQELLTNIQPYDGGFVTFGDGKKSRVVGKGELHIEGFPIFNGVLLVEDLKANLLSISQLCDDNMIVEFHKEKCIVKHGNNKVLTGIRSSDKCYLLEQEVNCLSVEYDELDHTGDHVPTLDDFSDQGCNDVGTSDEVNLTDAVDNSRDFSNVGTLSSPQLSHVPTSVQAESSGRMTRSIHWVNHRELAGLQFLSLIEPKNYNEDLLDEYWIATLQEELEQFELNDNKAMLDAQDYTQDEGVNIDETLASIARLESIRILLVMACTMIFSMYQKAVKSAPLHGVVNKEVYHRLKKVLYGSKQASQAWYKRLTTFPIQKGSRRGGEDTLLVFRVQDFVTLMQAELKMSMLGIFVRIKDDLKELHLNEVRRIIRVERKVMVAYVPTSRPFADMFTKLLDTATVELLRQHLGVCQI